MTDSFSLCKQKINEGCCFSSVTLGHLCQSKTKPWKCLKSGLICIIQPEEGAVLPEQTASLEFVFTADGGGSKKLMGNNSPQHVYFLR